jgi:hypothetical protein
MMTVLLADTPATIAQSAPAQAASAQAASPQAPAAAPAKKLNWILSLRSRYEIWDWFDPGDLPATANDNASYSFLGEQAHVGFRYDARRWLDVLADAQVTGLVGLPDDANAPAPFGDLGLGASYYAPHRKRTDARVFLNQAYVTLKRPAQPATFLRLGRFEYLDGTESFTGDPSLDWVKRNRIIARLIGTFGFSHSGRSFDGLRASLDRKRFNLTGVAAHPRQGGFEIEGMPDVSKVDVTSATLTLKPGTISKKGEGRAFWMYYRDGRTPAADAVVKVDNRPLAGRAADSAPISLHMLGGHYIQTIPAGSDTVDLLGFGVYQFGDWGLLEQASYAVAAEAGYQFADVPWKPWLRAGYSRGSGDDDPRDFKHRTFFQALTTVRLYAQFPFHNMMNNEDLFAQVILRPRPGKLLLRADLHLLDLTEPADLWYTGSGVIQKCCSFGYGGRPANGRSDLGTLLDVSATWDPHPRVNAYFYAGQAFGGDVVRAIYPRGTGGTFVYGELTLKY